VVVSSPQLSAVLWSAHERDREKVVTLADAGKLDQAVDALTGISRGDAAFDFYYYDTVAGQIADRRRADFEASIAGARDELSGWPVVPPVLCVVAALLVLLGIRPRLAEYQ
jgi:hypothetical protein